MAPKTAVLAIFIVVSFVFADHVKCQQLGRSQGPQLVGNGREDDNGGGSQGQELVGNGGGGGVSPKSDCNEQALYHGPCLEMICAAACLLQMHRGGHCKGGFFGACLCFVCS